MTLEVNLKMKNYFLLLGMSFAIFLGFSASAFADLCKDLDGDGYYVENTENDSSCVIPQIGSKGVEKKICDCPNLKVNEECSHFSNPLSDELISEVFNPSKRSSVLGKNINPGEIDVADNSIDENCDGSDSKLLSENSENISFESLGDKILGVLVKLITFASGAVLIWGGILYAIASGDEAKIHKARLTITGSVIGLIIGISAWSIIEFIINNVS